MSNEVTTYNEVVLNRRVYSTDNYDVCLCTITEAESGNELTVYGIFNREYGVREAEVRGYPHALKWADSLQKMIDDEAAERVKADSERSAIEEALGEAGQDAAVESFEAPNAMSKEEAEDFLDGVVASVTEGAVITEEGADMPAPEPESTPEEEE